MSQSRYRTEAEHVKYFIDHDLEGYLEELCGQFAPISLLIWKNMFARYHVSTIVDEIQVCFPDYFPEFDRFLRDEYPNI